MVMSNPNELDKLTATFPIEVEPDVQISEFDNDDFERQQVITAAIPETLPAARSAFCHDPLFNTLVSLYASANDITPEEMMKRNQGMLIGANFGQLNTDIENFPAEALFDLLELLDSNMGDSISMSDFEHNSHFYQKFLETIEPFLKEDHVL